ncbi:MAG: STAS/SEC14 domain-containing protein [Sphingobium sp.]
MYIIEFRHESNLLDIAWTGLFAADLVGAYARDVAMQFGRSGFRPGYRLRMDMTRSGLQPQAALARFADSFAAFPKASRIAVITPSALMGMQVRRMMTQPYLRIFAGAKEGLDWLLTSEDSTIDTPLLGGGWRTGNGRDGFRMVRAPESSAPGIGTSLAN